MIVVDMDGVLVDTHAKVLSHIEFVTGDKYTHEDITEYDYFQCLPEDAAKVALRAHTLVDFYDGLEPFPGAMEAVEALRSLDRVVVASVPTQGHLDSKHDWLLDQGFDRKDILILGDKSVLCWGGERSLIIEDHKATALDFELFNVNHSSIIMDRPWNQTGSHPLRSNVHRAHQWADVPELARSIYG